MFVYLIHFATPICHAQHYVGSTGHLRKRLEAHASGSGAKITAEARRRKITWHLGGLWQTTAANARRVERSLKNSKATPQYCNECATRPRALPNAIPYPPPPILPANIARIIAPTVNIATTSDFNYIKHLMQIERHSVGFIPDSGITTAINANHVLIATIDDAPAGYLLFTHDRTNHALKIQIAAVQDDARLLNVGRSLVNVLKASHPAAPITCKVRDDLPANLFWEAIGFQKLRTMKHQTSGSTLNQYHDPNE